MDRNNLTYHEKSDIDNTQKLRAVLAKLPPYAKDYFRSVEPSTSARTRISYAYDLAVFFEFLLDHDPALAGLEMKDVSLSHLSRLSLDDVEEFQEHLKYYEADGRAYANSPAGIARKLSALRSFFGYYYKKGLLPENIIDKMDRPKIRGKAIVRLEPDEVASLLDYVDKCGEGLSSRQLAYQKLTRERDLAIVTLFLGTGMRVSELVGLDIGDVSFKDCSVRVRRKGGNEAVLYFGPEVESALQGYVAGPRVQISLKALPGHEGALFYSIQRRRISVHAVEDMVRKYTAHVAGNKKITCHKLRSTFGTTLYQETGDIYLVADVLGHEDVNTTKKHYAAIEDSNRRKAASVIKLREP